ncbi:uncharacterized protein LOC129726201 [Wyeomyia smithii]|uniref:uncharacterized protein LOC129726201 n=1 Tax=Wyeomyia smithii TaxID=174621 RepID=UPI002467CF94|nr:uncharacterized protein LOC129726201 [Wyeomyia smithii]XP_055538913.1 uncharacterized protein LOC129726201 [Wyeomyia smithii]XP_055538914.1 uncharacterized protein LOC129726201 [Wyeomyia smithii]XP_055538915.1 uncharacterized protein LOC129726201 [Wyeomyia smithii]XP_055538916.1 uncharacterized protein LOC129726201 [Wyeomyia smithii]
MGNVLCKDPKTNSSPRAGKMFDYFGSSVCPNGLGKTSPGINKTYLGRHVLETTSKPGALDNWHNSTLIVPDGANGNVIDRPPVAPPRKKRATLERGTNPSQLKVKNGFKDVFGPDSRRPSHEVQMTKSVSSDIARDTVDEGLQGKSQSCYEIDAKIDAFSDFSIIPTKTELEKPQVEVRPENNLLEKATKIGNRKSDRLLGENLSDSLSFEPVATERRRNSKKGMDDLDKIDRFVETNVFNVKSKATERTNSFGKDKTQKMGLNQAISPVHAKILDTKESKQDQERERKLIKYIDDTVGKETNLGKKAEFLMAMLEDYPEDCYLGMVPVEEPIIVPRKRKSRHICDETDHMHDLLHKHEKENQPSKTVITTEASIETPPRKPNRDFGKYLGVLNGYSDSDESSSTRQVRKQRLPTRKSLPLPPPPRKLPKSLSETQLRVRLGNSAPLKQTDDSESIKAHSPRTLKRIISMPGTTNLGKPESRSPTPRPVLMKSNSSSSFLMKDLQKAHLSIGQFIPEDHRFNGADELVKPKSRLKIRKISIKSNESNSCTGTPTQETIPPKFTIGNREVVRSSTLPNKIDPPEVPKRNPPLSEGTNQHPLLKTVLRKQPLPREILGYDLGTFMVSSQTLHHHDITNIIEMVYSACASEENIIKEFQQYLEDHINEEINNPNSKYPQSAKLLELLNRKESVKKPDEVEDKLEYVKIDLVVSDDSNKSSDIDDCFDPEFEKIEKTELNDQLADIVPVNPLRSDSKGSVDDISDWFESGSEIGSGIEGSDKLGSMVSVKAHGPRMGRRESIEDVDDWFKNHIELWPAKETLMGVRKQRRGSDGLVIYDTSRQYPFGSAKQRRDSLSAEMFEDITKMHEIGVDKEKQSTAPVTLVKTERRGSEGTVSYDTSCKYPFGEPNTDFLKALENTEDNKINLTNNESNLSTNTDSNEEENNNIKVSNTTKGGTDHSTLLKFLSNEKLPN